MGNLLKNTRVRILLIVALSIILLVAGVTYLLLRDKNPPVPSGAELKKVPSIESIPGQTQASREYVRAQQLENLRQAQEAARKGTAAVPTVTSTSYLGPNDLVPGRVAPPGCSPDELRRARMAGVKAEELRCKGCSAAELRAAGYTAGELVNAGFSAKELRAAGYTPEELRAAGFTAAELARAGFSPQELAAAGFSAAELAQAGVNANQLTALGLNSDQLRAAGLGPKEALPKDCTISALLDAHKRGISAGKIRGMGCSAAAMRAAGFTAAELKAAGFSAAELKQAGFSCQELKDAGFPIGELRQANCTAADLAKLGVSAADLRAGGYDSDALKKAGFTPAQLKGAGYSDGELLRAGYTPDETAPKPVAVVTEPLSPPPLPTAPPSQGLSAVLPVSDDDTASVAALERLQKRQQAQLSQQQRDDALNSISTSMTAQANQLFASWSPPPTQQVIMAKPPEEQTRQGAAQTLAVVGKGGKVVDLAQAEQAGPVIKAGTVMYGVLDTSINSDEKTPILATIVDGELKGTKMVGSFDRVDKKVLVTFKSMNVPELNSSISVDAVAIDPNTARTALATDVDNHYLLRYGTLFASAFTSGLAQAISQSGSQQSTGSGGTVVTYDNLNIGEELAVALGQVGTQYAAVLGSNFTRPPTVKVDPGSGIGVLFMSDVKVPIAAQTPG